MVGRADLPASDHFLEVGAQVQAHAASAGAEEGVEILPAGDLRQRFGGGAPRGGVFRAAVELVDRTVVPREFPQGGQDVGSFVGVGALVVGAFQIEVDAGAVVAQVERQVAVGRRQQEVADVGLAAVPRQLAVEGGVLRRPVLQQLRGGSAADQRVGVLQARNEGVADG